MTDKFKMARQCDQMNRKNRQAAHAGSASVQFNTFLYFKERNNEVKEAIVMRITKAGGIYVIIQKYGIEGFIMENDQEHQSIVIDNDKNVNWLLLLQSYIQEAIVNEQVRV